MKKRSPVTVIFLSLVTLGIYQLYWLVVTRNEMVKKGQKIPSTLLLFAPLLVFLGVLVLQLFVGLILSTPVLDQSRAFINILTVFLGFGAFIAIFPVWIYWTWQYCKAVEVITGKKIEASLAFIIGLLLALFGAGFIWSGIIQDYFNKTEQ